MVLNEKGILQQFDLVIYPVGLVIAIGDMEKEINRFYKPFDSQYEHIGFPGNNPAATYRIKEKKTGDNYCLIWIPKTDNVKGSYLCHECGHVALEVFEYIGAHVDCDEQEPFCYLLGTIFRLCNNAFYHWKDFVESKTKKN
jgi:hypothetical protein